MLMVNKSRFTNFDIYFNYGELLTDDKGLFLVLSYNSKAGESPALCLHVLY
jgi:hypothetical protein